MSKLYMLVGTSGSGKSTWAKENLNKENMFTKIFSSDEYREKLLGDINDQSNNNLIFKKLNIDTYNALKDGIDVCYDATNLTKCDRRILLGLLFGLDCEKIAVVFNTPEKVARDRNNNRNRKVPDDVITRQITKFNLPTLAEGFDSIITVSCET